MGLVNIQILREWLLKCLLEIAKWMDLFEEEVGYLVN